MNGLCSHERLELALAGLLNASDESTLHCHLEQCELCSAEMERLSGGEQAFQEIAAMLTPDDLADRLPPREECSTADFVVDHLEPSDDPAVLGRLGGYDVLDVIGQGGMGVVLKGFDRELKRFVAIKALAPHLAHSALARKRFAREAQAAAAVVNPHVIAIHQVQPNGQLPFLVMPLLTGDSLAQRLKSRGTLDLKEILRIGMQAAEGLAAAHEQGLIHRDVKPANILLEKGVDRAVLTDFGLARAADDVSMTRWGIIAGTPEYMSPEQARGEALDSRSDLFSMGCVLYEMATGVSPFRTDSSMATMRRLVHETPKSMAALNPELPQWFIAIVDCLLEKDPSRRFNSAREVCELLEGCLAHVQQPTSVPLPASLPKLAFLDKRRPSVYRFLGVLIMMAAFGIGLFGFLLFSAEPPDITGQWSGEEWGQVVLTRTTDTEYAGTYNDTFGKQPGEIRLKWSRIERRFNGTWREGEDRFGELSVRRVSDEIRGAHTTDPKSKINPATPRLADLSWIRAKAPGAPFKGEAFGPVFERVVRNREAIDFDTGRQALLPDAELNPEKGLLWILEQRLDSITTWMGEHQMDALSEGDSLMTFGLKVNELTTADWNTTNPSQLMDALKVDWEQVNPRQFGKAIHPIDPQARPHVILSLRTSPRTLAFQTREGGMGILQIMEATKAGLKIRFKLVQGAEARTAEAINSSQGRFSTGEWWRDVAVMTAPRFEAVSLRLPLGKLRPEIGIQPDWWQPQLGELSGQPATRVELRLPEELREDRNWRAHWRVLAFDQEGREQPPDTDSAYATGADGLIDTSVLAQRFKTPKDAVRKVVVQYSPVEEPLAKVPPEPAVAAKPNFGPVMERVLPSGAPCREQYFQFRSGELFVVGNGPGTSKEEAAHDEKRIEDAGGVDMSANRNEVQIFIYGRGCFFTRDFGELKWDRITAEQVVQALKRARHVEGEVTPMKKDLPFSYLFKTARGEVGIMEVLGSAEVKHEGWTENGMKFRYKLVQGTGTTTPAAPPLVFGAGTQGLQAALEVTAGEPFKLRIHIRNVSDRGISIDGAHYRQEDECILSDAQGQPVPVTKVTHDIRIGMKGGYFGPGQVAVFECAGLSFQAIDKVPASAGYVAQSNPGRYTLRFRIRLPGDDLPFAAGKHAWKGELETGPVTIDVQDPATQSVAPVADSVYSAILGPVVERVVCDLQTTRENCALSFDSGKLLSVPANITFDTLTDPSAQPTAVAWARDNGVDAIAFVTTDGDKIVKFGLLCPGLVVLRANNKEWNPDQATPQDLKERFNKAMHEWKEIPQIAEITIDEQFPGTCMILDTHTHRRGVLQIMGVADDPRGVKIRYRLVEGAPVKNISHTTQPTAR